MDSCFRRNDGSFGAWRTPFPVKYFRGGILYPAPSIKHPRLPRLKAMPMAGRQDRVSHVKPS
jgi:hypothetical protein